MTSERDPLLATANSGRLGSLWATLTATGRRMGRPFEPAPAQEPAPWAGGGRQRKKTVDPNEQRDPLFMKHCEEQSLIHRAKGVLTVQVPYNTKTGEYFGAEKIVHYSDEKASTFLILFLVTGTCFHNKANWMTCAMYWLGSALTSVILIWDRADGHSNIRPLDDPAQREAFDDLTKYLTALVAFMLGLFVTTMVSRWWQMRTQLCNFFSTIHDLISRIATRMKNPSDRKFRERLLRLCLLSHRLIFDQARGEESRNDLQAHVDAGLMSTEELEALVGKQGKPMVVWMWINSLFHALCTQGKIKDLTPPVVARFDGIFAAASSAITNICSYIDTQIPFPYVHILTFLVVANNILIAVKTGVLIGNCVGPGGYPDNTVVILEVCHVVIVPFVYHSFLTMGFELANPFGYDEVDFPGYAYSIHCRDMEIACMEAADNPPASVLEDLLDLEKGTKECDDGEDEKGSEMEEEADQAWDDDE